jgi:hypothetical protein
MPTNATFHAITVKGTASKRSIPPDKVEGRIASLAIGGRGIVIVSNGHLRFFVLKVEGGFDVHRADGSFWAFYEKAAEAVKGMIEDVENSFWMSS